MSVNKKKRATKDGRCWVFQTSYKNLLGEVKNYTSKRFKTKKEAQEAERIFIETLTNKFDYSEMTFLDLYNKYIEKQKHTVKKTTMHSYYQRWEYLKDLSNVKLVDFDIPHYELWRRTIMNINISDEYRNDIQKFLKILLNFGSKWYDMNFLNVYNKITKFNDPNAPLKEEMKFYTFEEYKKFISQEDTLLFRCAFDILYFCGLRRGELLGLTWENIDFDKNEIKVRNNIVRNFDDGGYLLTTPKTKSSVRNIPMTENLAEELKLLKEESKKIYGFNQKWFVLGYDKPLTFSKIRSRKQYLSEKAELKQIRLHDFRHSCASLLISRGANITLVAKYLGHTKIEQTLNVYSHFFKSDLESLVNSLNEMNLPKFVV